MPKPRILSRSIHLTKYAFPVIRSLIDRVGAPREIEKVAPQQRGPLLVTLAMDISSDCAREICSHLEVTSEKDTLPLESLVPDMLEGLPVKPGSAGHILLMKNARWWAEFAQKAEGRFRTLASSTGPIRILLRSAVANAAATDLDLQKKTGSYDAVWLEIVKSPANFFASGRWPRQSFISGSNLEGIRKLRSNLIKEDSKQCDWILEKSGAPHPSTSSYWGSALLRNPEYTVWRARNELYYCLSQGDAGLWVPLFSGSFSEAEWKVWLKKAKSKGPSYWSPPSTEPASNPETCRAASP